jgi:hypothetical protein
MLTKEDNGNLAEEANSNATRVVKNQSDKFLIATRERFRLLTEWLSRR